VYSPQREQLVPLSRLFLNQVRSTIVASQIGKTDQRHANYELKMTKIARDVVWWVHLEFNGVPLPRTVVPFSVQFRHLSNFLTIGHFPSGRSIF